MSGKQKKNLVRILIAAALTGGMHFVPVSGVVRFLIYLGIYLFIGYDILRKAFLGIRNRQPLDENLLMSVATVGAFALALYRGTGDYTEAIAVMLFYQIGEWFQSYAVGKSRRNITELMNIAPDTANIENENGQIEPVDPEDVDVGAVIVVQPGERVPIDGVILSGSSSLDTSALTGESMPRDVREGDEILSGCINRSGVLRIETTKIFGESTASRVMEMIEDASSRKSRSENFISRFARVYTPAVVYAALALGILPPLILLILGRDAAWGVWIYRALTFLVINCPCALVVSIPLSFFAGIGGAGRQGILIKGSNYLEALSETSTAVFDKTGTLTKGVFQVTDVHPEGMSAEELLLLCAQAERYSVHPIAVSLREACPSDHGEYTVEDVRETAGHGVTARVNGKTVTVGNGRHLKQAGVGSAPDREIETAGTILHAAVDGRYAGYLVISDVIKPNSVQTIRELKRIGLETVMLTGDGKAAADAVAGKLGISHVYSELLPQDKVSRVEKLMAERGDGKGKVAFVGDGLNDAPVLARADVGIAMGAMGSDAAIEAADLVLMDDDPMKLVTAVRIARKCMRIVKENTWGAILIKLACLLLGALGITNMWAAIFADVGVMVLAVLNAIRCLFIGPARPGGK